MQRRIAEKSSSKKNRKANLVNNTYLENKKETKNFINNAIDKEEYELHQILLNVDPEYRRQIITPTEKK